jgi:hypothetical protein
VPPIDPEQFADRVYEASKAAFSALIGENTGQTFYAFGLFTDDSLQFVHPVANTEESLTATVQRYRETVDPRYGCTSTRAGMRWSYGDWGFFPYQDGDHFGEINRMLGSNFDRMVADEEFDGGLEPLCASTREEKGTFKINEAEQSAAPDCGGRSAFHGSLSRQPPQQVSFVVRPRVVSWGYTNETWSS